MRGWLTSLSLVERRALVGAIVLGWAVRLIYIASTRGHQLVGDEPAYHASAVLQTQGRWFWSTVPYGVPHESFQKTPVYQVFAGLVYEVLGTNPDRLFAVQAVLLSPLVVVLAFVLARRLFGPAAAVATALVVAVHPNVWQFEVRMYSESLAIPMTVGMLVLALTCRPTRKVVVGAGLLLGLLLLTRPSSLFVVPALLLAWWATDGARGGIVRTAAVCAIAVLCVVPWTLRNHSVDDSHWVPLSVQDAAAYGTFNDDAANDPNYPYKWRPFVSRDRDVLLGEPRRLSDGEFRAELSSRAREWAKDHPGGVAKAFWHNGIVRLWDVDPPSQSLDDAAFEGRTRAVTGIGLGLYWLLLLPAALGLRRLWQTGRRGVVLALAASALAASVVYTADAGTRYRAPLEPVLVALAAGGVLGARGLGRLER
ncbi:glycosyltransferase family 39 protein [Conexibacter sp. SYSU D00693]|uniref:glycosyltransferase family 39 protein n=1 Tax=Conexibacter sp. SYSU D00693 TaxID=2812560 RepID=UPI00196A8B31|nr:glycosyltransferase family 39 protein [Conexibacter sp. SYSU D00693]